MFKTLLIASLLAGCLAAAGCGNKGPLYLPQPPDTRDETDQTRK